MKTGLWNEKYFAPNPPHDAAKQPTNFQPSTHNVLLINLHANLCDANYVGNTSDRHLDQRSEKH